jgi:HEPN domain-containing protein
MTNDEINNRIKVLRSGIINRNRKISGAYNGSGYPMERYNSDYYDELNADAEREIEVLEEVLEKNGKQQELEEVDIRVIEYAAYGWDV